MSISYKIALFLDALVLLYGTWTVLSDKLKYPGSATYDKLGVVTLVFFAWLVGSFFLYRYGMKTLASWMVWVPAIPILGYGFFVLLFIIFKPDMR